VIACQENNNAVSPPAWIQGFVWVCFLCAVQKTHPHILFAVEIPEAPIFLGIDFLVGSAIIGVGLS
jgi:hypothetical protein